MAHELTLDEYEALVHLIYSAGLDPGNWQAALDELDRVVDGAHISLYGHDTAAGLALGHVTTRYAPEFLGTYVDHYCNTNPFTDVLLRAPVLQMNRSEKWVARDELVRTEFYNDWLRPQEDIITGGGGVLFNDEGRLLIISGQVRDDDDSGKADRLIAILARLAPHMRRAFEINRTLEGGRFLIERYESVLEAMPKAAFVLDGRGRIDRLNRRADALLVAARPLHRDRDGTLRARDPKADRALHDALARIAEGRIDGCRLTFALADPSGEGRSLCALVPLAGRDAGAWGFPAIVKDRRAIALLVVTEMNEGARLHRDALKMLFDLSPAEARLVEALHAGATLQAFAARAGISYHTARKQLRSVFEKTGTNRQSQLLALVERLAVETGGG